MSGAAEVDDKQDGEVADDADKAQAALVANDVERVLARAGPTTNWLSLIGAGLAQVPAQVCHANYPFLTQLYLGHNRLTVLPDGLWDCVSLRGLFLQNNRLTRISPNIERLTDLQELYLSSNQLVAVPSLAALTMLDCLWLDGNDSLPARISRNISRNKDGVQSLILDIRALYGHRSANCRRSTLFFLHAFSEALPRELLLMIGRDLLYSSRFDDNWQY